MKHNPSEKLTFYNERSRMITGLQVIFEGGVMIDLERFKEDRFECEY